MASPLVRQASASINDVSGRGREEKGALEAFQTGKLTRTIELPYYEKQRRSLQLESTWLGKLFSRHHGIRIYDIDLQEDWVLIENTTAIPVNMGQYCLCDEERRDKLQFPSDLLLEPKSFLKVICALESTKSMEAFEDEDVRTTLLLWKTAEGAVRTDHVLRQDGDCMYLYDESGTMISAFAKTSGGAFKEYGAVNEVAEQGAWRFLSLSCALLRLGLLVLAGYHAFHTNLSSRAAAAHPGWVLGPCTGALVLDLCQREAGLYAHVHDFFGEALSLLADRLHAMVVYGTLALFYGDYCGLFLALLLLDLAACWAQLFASDCGEIEMKGLAGTLAAKAPALLVAICLASEAFLLLLYVDHGHVQFRLFQGMATGTAFLFQSPVLTIPVVKDLLLVAFLLKQLMAVSQLYCCTASLMSTTFPCVSDEAKSFLQQAIDARQRPNLEYLRNSESLHTLRGEASPFFRR